jgi:hypothetical protein
MSIVTAGERGDGEECNSFGGGLARRGAAGRKEGLPPGGEPLLWEEMVQRPGPGLEGRVSG